MYIDPIIMQMDESIDRERFVIATLLLRSKIHDEHDEVRSRPCGRADYRYLASGARGRLRRCGSAA